MVQQGSQDADGQGQIGLDLGGCRATAARSSRSRRWERSAPGSGEKSTGRFQTVGETDHQPTDEGDGKHQQNRHLPAESVRHESVGPTRSARPAESEMHLNRFHLVNYQ